MHKSNCAMTLGLIEGMQWILDCHHHHLYQHCAIEDDEMGEAVKKWVGFSFVAILVCN